MLGAWENVQDEQEIVQEQILLIAEMLGVPTVGISLQGPNQGKIFIWDGDFELTLQASLLVESDT